NRYLPYAQVFGLAEHWTARFAAVGAAVPAGWGTPSSSNGVAALLFVDSYSSFTSTVVSSVATPITVSADTSSTSSWSGGSSGFDSSSSGSSGGGDYSGGGDGGGGGGVGSW